MRLYTVVFSPRTPCLALRAKQCVATEWLRAAKRQLPSFAPTARTTNGQSELSQAATQASSVVVLSRRKETLSCPPCMSRWWRRDAGASFRLGYGEQRVFSSFSQPFQITRLSSSAGLGTGATLATVDTVVPPVHTRARAHTHTHTYRTRRICNCTECIKRTHTHTQCLYLTDKYRVLREANRLARTRRIWNWTQDDCRRQSLVCTATNNDLCGRSFCRRRKHCSLLSFCTYKHMREPALETVGQRV